MAYDELNDFPYDSNDTQSDEENNILQSLLAQRMKSLFSSDDATQQRLESLLNSYPVREKPSRFQSIMSRLAGLSAASPQGISGGQPIGFSFNPIAAQKISENYLNSGYDRRLQDWENQFKAAVNVAGLDLKGQAVQRALLGNILSNDARRYASDQATNRIPLRTQGQIEIENAKQPNRLELEDVRQSGREKLEGQREEGASQLESQRQKGRIQLEGVRQPNRISLEKTRQEGRVDLESEKEKNRAANIGLRGEESRKTKQTPSGSTSSNAKGESEASIAKGRVNRANKLIAEHPEWAKFVTVNGNQVSIKQPGSGLFSSGPSKNDYDNIVKIIMGSPSQQDTAKKSKYVVTVSE